MSVDPLFDVTGQVVMIAGGAGGLGEALAHGFADRGAHCAIADTNTEGGAGVVRRLPGRGHSVHSLDITSEQKCNFAIESVLNTHGHIGTLINCCGRLVIESSDSIHIETFSELIDLNTVGAFRIARSAALAMRERRIPGRIITMSSVSSVVVNSGYVAYGTSKGALMQLTRILAKEWAKYGITVNALAPAMTETQMTAGFLNDESFSQKALDSIPMGRYGTPSDIIGSAILLSSVAGSFITGQTLYIDGGRTLN